MSSVVLVLFGLGIFFLGYRFYSHFIGNRIYAINDLDLITPAHEFEDGVDYLPTKRHILFGHHFTSIAGAAPIIGPCVAAYWGWLPAFVWVVLGTVFMGAVHDFGALVISIKEKGRSIADITASVISRRTRIMFLIFVMMLIWLVLAVFAMAIADLFVSIPSSVLPINIQIIVALIIGWIIYKKGMNTFIPSIITEGVPAEYYDLLRCGEIKPWNPYGCRVWTAKHMHHLPKYTGGLIFCAVQIPADTKILIKSFGIRTILIANQTVLIVGFANQSAIKGKKPTWHTPESPSGKRRKYNSENFIFHHSEITSIKELI